MPSMTGSGSIYDAKTTPTRDMGIVAEAFWRMPGTLRGDHPTSTFAARGPLAAQIVAPQPIEPPHGLDSPIGRVWQHDGWVLLLGVGHDANTTIHLAENISRVPYHTRDVVRVADGGIVRQVAFVEVNHCCQNFNKVAMHLQARGQLELGKVGNARAQLMRSRDVVAVARELIARDTFYFLCPTDKGCAECDEARANALSRGPFSQSTGALYSDLLGRPTVTDHIQTNRAFSIIGVPMDLGQRRRGVDMGPSVIRYAGLHQQLRALGHTITDSGNLQVPLPENELPEPIHSPLGAGVEGGRARHLHSIAKVCRDIYDAAYDINQRGEIALFLGGDHSLSIGTVSAITAHPSSFDKLRIAQEDSVGVLWVDAHGDFNTPDITPSGNVHGMSLAALMGLGAPELTDIGHAGAKIQPSQAVILGARDLDPLEKKALKEMGVRVFTMRDIDERGIAAVTHLALAHLQSCQRIHVSLDMDALDPSEAPGVGTPVPGGLSYREAHLLMEILNDTGKVTSADIVEINPILDDRNRTARLAVELIASLFGKTIF
jgi:arginase